MKRILFLNFLMLTFFNFAHPVTPEMMSVKGSPDALFGLLFMMMSLGTFLFAPIWGNKIDRNGTKKIMVFAPIGYLLGQIIFAYSQFSIIMMLARLISGIFASAWIVGTGAYINLNSKEDKKVRNFGFQMVAANLGAIVGQTLSGYIGINNYMNSFYVQFLGLFSVSILAFLLLKNLYPENKVTTKTSFISSFKLIHKKHFTFILLSMVAISFMCNTFFSTIAYFGADVLGFDTIEISRLNSYVAFLGMISNLFIVKKLSARFTFFKSMSIQYIGALIGTIIILFVLIDSYIMGVFIIGITLLTLSINMYRPFVQSYLINSKQFNPGEIVGVVASFNAIGMIGGSFTFSLFYPINEILPFMILIIYAIIGFVFLLIGKNHIAQNYPNHE